MSRRSWPDTRLTDLLGIEMPIVQAPMAGSSTLEMALAVREAGGLGSLACAPFDEGALDRHLVKARTAVGTASDAPLNANFFAHAPTPPLTSSASPWVQRLAPYHQRSGTQSPGRLEAGVLTPFDEARCEVVLARRAKLVSFHFGLPKAHFVDSLKQAGAVVMSSATSVREARWLADRGCDVIIAQGAEAGGHRGNFLERDMSTQLGTLALTPQVVDAVDVPVIAAGGIADGRGIAAAFALGAAGVQIGTAFLFTREATISPLHHAAISGETATSTAITNVFSGRPARCVLNRAVRELGPMHDESPEFPLGFAAMAPLRAEAEGRGCRDFSAHYCGQSAPLSRGGPVGAADLTQWLADDARRILGGMA